MSARKTTSLVLAALIITCGAVAQTTTPALSSDQIVDKVASSIALVLAGNGTGDLTALGAGVIVRPEGVLLTAYHGVKNAKELQVRLKNGEIYDEVQLIGFDARRDVAALRIMGANLPAVTVTSSGELKPGAAVYVVSQGRGSPSSAAAGLLNSTRLAEDIPGAGSGYRLLQFTAPIAPDVSGGVLVDTQGRAVGIVMAALTTGQNVNFAVPLDAVLGLATRPGGTAFASGAALKLPQNEPLPTEPVVKAEALTPTTVAPPAPPIAARPAESLNRLDAPDNANSQPIESRDPQNILRKFRTVYVDSQTQWLKPNVMKSAFYKKREFTEWGVAVVDEASLADVVLRIHLVGGTEDYTYELQHQNTSVIISSGKVTGFTPILWMSGNAAAPKIADGIVKAMRAAGRVVPSEEQKRLEQQKKEEAKKAKKG